MSQPALADFTPLDEFIGYVSRRAEEIRFSYWWFYISMDPAGRQLLAVDCSVKMKTGAIPGRAASYLDEDVAWEMVSPRLNRVVICLEEKAKQKGLEVVSSPRQPIRKRREDSSRFAPPFFVKGKGVHAIEHGD